MPVLRFSCQDRCPLVPSAGPVTAGYDANYGSPMVKKNPIFHPTAASGHKVVHS